MKQVNAACACVYVCVCVRVCGGGDAELFYVKNGGTYCSHYALNGQALCCVNVMAEIRVDNRRRTGI